MCYFSLDIVMLSCASVYICLVVNCWERADLLALVCDVKLWSCHFPIVILGQVWCLVVSTPDLCPLSYFYNMDVIYMYAVMYCLCQNPTIIFEPVSSKRYKLTCVPIHAVWAVYRQEMAWKTKSLISLFWCADWFEYLWYEQTSLYLMLDTS